MQRIQPVSKDEIIHFQQYYNDCGLDGMGRDYFGKPLVVDGDFGQKSRWAWEVEQLEEERLYVLGATLRLYARGVVETSPNAGPIVDEIIKPSGLGAVPWCICTVSYIHRDALIRFREALDDPYAQWWPAQYFASAWRLRRAMDGLKRDVPLEAALPGDTFSFMRTDTEGHGGILLAFGGINRSWMLTAEGNSGNAMRIGTRSTAIPGLRFHSAVPVQRSPILASNKGLIALDGSATR